MNASDIPLGTVMTAFFNVDNRKVDGQKIKENLILAISFITWQGQRIGREQRTVYLLHSWKARPVPSVSLSLEAESSHHVTAASLFEISPAPAIAFHQFVGLFWAPGSSGIVREVARRQRLPHVQHGLTMPQAASTMSARWKSVASPIMQSCIRRSYPVECVLRNNRRR